MSGLPPVDRFTTTQIVRGAILTCAQPSVSAATPGCLAGMRLNGMEIRWGNPQMDVICNAVTGAAGRSPAPPSGASVPHFIWNGTTWVLSSAGSVMAMDGVICHLSANAAAGRPSTRRIGRQPKFAARSALRGRKGR